MCGWHEGRTTAGAVPTRSNSAPRFAPPTPPVAARQNHFCAGHLLAGGWCLLSGILPTVRADPPCASSLLLARAPLEVALRRLPPLASASGCAAVPGRAAGEEPGQTRAPDHGRSALASLRMRQCHTGAPSVRAQEVLPAVHGRGCGHAGAALHSLPLGAPALLPAGLVGGTWLALPCSCAAAGTDEDRPACRLLGAWGLQCRTWDQQGAGEHSGRGAAAAHARLCCLQQERAPPRCPPLLPCRCYLVSLCTWIGARRQRRWLAAGVPMRRRARPPAQPLRFRSTSTFLLTSPLPCGSLPPRPTPCSCCTSGYIPPACCWPRWVGG